MESRPVHSTTTPPRPEDADLYEGPRVTKDGIPIIEVQRGQAPAPNPHSQHKLVDFKYLQMILLGDREGTVRYRCARFLNGDSGERCWRDDFDNPRSAVAHINGHGYSRAPDYPVETLKLLTRLVRTFKAAGKRNYAVLTAEELNRTGVPTLNGEPWNAMQVSGLFGTHGHKFRTPLRKDEVRRLTGATLIDTAPTTPTISTERTEEPTVPTSPPPAKSTKQAAASLAELDALSGKLVREAASLFDLHKAFAVDLAEFVELVGVKLAVEAAKPDADPEIVEKAAKWDKYVEFQKLLNS